MIVGHTHRFIFIKTVKTAGTSIEVELSQIVEEEAIVTPIYPPNENHKPRNYKLDDGRKFYNHMPATEVSVYLGKERFASYFKFCVEREPVDKCISHFSMRKNSPYHNETTKHKTWFDYVKEKKFPVDAKKYLSKTGNLLVDRIIRYENLPEEMDKLCEQLGIAKLALKTREKSGFRESVPISRSDLKIIYKKFKKTNKHTCYKLDDFNCSG